MVAMDKSAANGTGVLLKLIRPALEHDGGVDAAEAESVDHGIAGRLGTRLWPDQIGARESFVTLFEIKGRRQGAGPQRLDGQDRRRRAGRTEQMSGRRLGR